MNAAAMLINDKLIDNMPQQRRMRMLGSTVLQASIYLFTWPGKRRYM